MTLTQQHELLLDVDQTNKAMNKSLVCWLVMQGKKTKIVLKPYEKAMIQTPARSGAKRMIGGVFDDSATPPIIRLAPDLAGAIKLIKKNKRCF